MNKFVKFLPKSLRGFFRSRPTPKPILKVKVKRKPIKPKFSKPEIVWPGDGFTIKQLSDANPSYSRDELMVAIGSGMKKKKTLLS